MQDDVCWLWFGVGGQSCSTFLASTVGLNSYQHHLEVYDAMTIRGIWGHDAGIV